MNVKTIRVLLLEVPGVVLELKGDLLGEMTLKHAKYPQLLLAANLSRPTNHHFDYHVGFVDLKSVESPRLSRVRDIDYVGERLGVWRIGSPVEALEDYLPHVDIVGISANFTFERNMVVETLASIRKKFPGLIVVGGHDATASPMYYLERGADICVLGEGETAIQDISAAMARGELEKVSGIAFLDHGRIRKNGKRKNHDLDQIEFPTAGLLRRFRYDECPDGLVPEGVNRTFAVIETSRGCDERCSFCDSSFIVGAFRTVQLKRLLSQLDVLRDAEIRTLLFADDNLLYRILPKFGGERGRTDLIRFFEAAFERGFAWTFYNGIQFGLLETAGKIDRELLEVLFRHSNGERGFRGCFRAYIPLEKFNAPEMILLPKLKPLEVEAEILGAISGMEVPELNLGFIVGTPRETRESIHQSLIKAAEFGRIVSRESTGKSVPRFFPWCSVPIPGTPDRRYFSANMMYDEVENPELFNNYTSVIRNDCFSPLDITLERARLSKVLNDGKLKLHRVDAEAQF